MAITAGQTIAAADFVASSAGAGSASLGVKLNAGGKVDTTMLAFGGTGADGALNVTSGTTTIDLTGLQYFIKNYTSINISAGATVNFINPHANGTIIALKSMGNVTVAGTLDASGMGAASSTNGFGVTTVSNFGSNGTGHQTSDTGPAGTAVQFLTNIAGKTIRVTPGAGGGQGAAGGSGATGGVGGRGGAGLIIECGGTWTFTGTISVAGKVGSIGGNTNPGGGAGGGGGGGGGTFAGIANIIGTNTGTITKSGGNGGIGGAGGTSSGTTDVNRGGAGAGGGANNKAGGAGGAGNGNNAGANGSGTTGGTGGTFGSNAAGSQGGSGGGGGAEGEGYVVQNTEF